MRLRRRRRDFPSRRKQRESPFNPDRAVRLFGKAGWAARAAAILGACVAVAGAALAVLPFSVQLSNPEPPPVSMHASCPPAMVSAVAGRGGQRTDPAVDWLEAEHERGCARNGRLRLAGGLALVLAGAVNAVAALEWARIRERDRRRRRREERRASRSGGRERPRRDDRRRR